MVNENILICSVVKNVENVIAENIKHAINTGVYFNKYKVIIYENNSTDDTKNILKQYENNENLKIISEDIQNINLQENNALWTYSEITGSNHPCRMEHISNARNKVLKEILKTEYDNFNYVMFVDMDSHGWTIDGIIDSFNKKDECDAIFANSIPYYDYYALRCDEQLYGPEIVGEYFWQNMPSLNFNREGLVKIYSAFNGIGIYKRNILKDATYNFQVNDEIKKFYRKKISDDNFLTPVIETPCKKFPFGFADEDSNIFWKSNSGYKGIVICEHIGLNFTLYNNNYRLFINPKMLYYR